MQTTSLCLLQYTQGRWLMSNSLRNILLQEVRDKFPKIDWRLGSVVRELIIEPLAKLGDEVDKYINTAKASLDVMNICENPTENEEALNAWAERLGITPPVSKVSSGTVRIVRKNAETLVVPAGTQFIWNDEVVVYTTDTYTLTSPGKNTGSANRIEYISYYGSAFSADIPVSCYPDTGHSLSEGAPLNWTGAPTDVYDIHIGSAVSGGSETYTLYEKAAQIQDALTPDSLSGEACIKKALRRNFPEFVSDVIVGDKDISKPYAVSLYIKPTRSLQQFEIPLAIKEGRGTIDGCGIHSILEIFDSAGVVHKAAIKTSEDFGDTGSVADIALSDDTISGDFKARVVGFSAYKEINTWLIGAAKSTPFEFNLKLPAVGVVSVICPAKTSDYSGARTEVAGFISSIPMNGTSSDSDIIKILQNHDITVTGPIIYSVSVYHNMNKTVKTMFGGLSPDTLRYYTSSPVAFYSNDNLVEIKSA